jgi:hypothetical protein
MGEGFLLCTILANVLYFYSETNEKVRACVWDAGESFWTEEEATEGLRKLAYQGSS